MADSYEKTEEPTAKKIQDARKKGQVARSRELSTALVLIFSAIAFFMFGFLNFISENLVSVYEIF